MTPTCKALFSGATLSDWQDGYRNGSLLLNSLLEAFGPDVDDAGRNDPAWITRLDEARLKRSAPRPGHVAGGDWRRYREISLYGIPFAVKDNMDVAGWPTSAGCPRFSCVALEDATVVRRLRQNTFRPEYICGGSSSGSSSVVARGIVPFALGTDTAGSGRVPAGMGFNPTMLFTLSILMSFRLTESLGIAAI